MSEAKRKVYTTADLLKLDNELSDDCAENYADLGDYAEIAAGTDGSFRIALGDYAKIGDNSNICDYIRIGDHAVIGNHVTFWCGAEIGNNAVIGDDFYTASPCFSVGANAKIGKNFRSDEDGEFGGGTIFGNNAFFVGEPVFGENCVFGENMAVVTDVSTEEKANYQKDR